MTAIFALEYELMSYCLKYKGKWWANHFFRNKAANTLYARLRGFDIGTVIAILGSGWESHERHIMIAGKLSITH